MLKETFIQLIKNYTPDDNLAENLWTEIEKSYNKKRRYYHNLLHLHNLLEQLLAVKNEIDNWDATLFTLYYHDIVYSTLKTDNEEKSAILAEKRMKEIAVPVNTIELTTQQVLASQSHNTSSNSDVNYFTDADLCILGNDWEAYAAYFKKIRKEYAVYPSVVYNGGRKKVLQHFLNMNRIFKTDFFFKKFETQAKLNLSKELELY